MAEKSQNYCKQTDVIKSLNSLLIIKTVNMCDSFYNKQIWLEIIKSLKFTLGFEKKL